MMNPLFKTYQVRPAFVVENCRVENVTHGITVAAPLYIDEPREHFEPIEDEL